MIKGTPLFTLEQILKHSSEEDIMKYYIGHDFELGVPFQSPFREDRTPSFTITDKGDFLYFKDWGSDESGNIVSFLKLIFPGMDYSQILSKVAEDMGTKYFVHNESRNKSLSPKKRSPTIIQVTKRDFDTADLAYWKSYHITRRDLEENDVYAVKRYSVNGTPMSLPVTEMCFGYLFKDQGEFFWKIYRPYAADKKNKWRYSGPNDYMYGMDNISHSSKVLVTKSLKDYMVIRKVYSAVCGVQSEESNTINEKNLKLMEGKEVYINFDNDSPGRRAAQGMVNKYGFKVIFVPDCYAPIKDIADLAQQKGMGAVELLIKNSNLII